MNTITEVGRPTTVAGGNGIERIIPYFFGSVSIPLFRVLPQTQN
jgi:hypothetical protein